MSGSPLTAAHQHLMTALEEPSTIAAGATDTELLSILTLCEGLTRRLDQLTVTTIATLERAAQSPNAATAPPPPR